MPADPVSRRLGWFSLVGGEDIRAACSAPRTPTQYRFVYNAVYTEQVRVYDFVAGPNGGRLDSVVLTGGISLGASTFAQLVDLVPGTRDAQRLSATDAQQLLAAVDTSAVHAPTPVGLRLRSDAFYWTVAACVGGRFHFTAFDHPSARFAALRFPAELFRLERTGVAVNPPRPLDLDPFEAAGTERGSGRRSQLRFLLEVGRDGLVR